MTELEVDGTDLKRGDIITAVRVKGSTNWNNWGNQEVVENASIGKNSFGGSFVSFKTKTSEGREYKESRPLDLIYQIRRVVKQDPLRSVFVEEVKKKHIDEFPSTCTRCGAKAYVSAFTVIHKNETAATDCPARRG